MPELPPINQRYGIDTTDFKTGMAAMNRAIRDLEGEFKASAASLGDWSKTATGLEGRVGSLTDLIDVQKQKVTAMREE